MFLFPLLGILACDPLAKNAGIIETSDTDVGQQTTGASTESADSGTADSGTDGSGAVPGFGAIASPLGMGTVAVQLVASPNGVVAATLSGSPPYDLAVAEYDNDLNELWSLSLGEGWISDLTALPEGGYLAGGRDVTGTAAAWRLSCCGAIEDAQVYPTMSEDPAGIIVAQPHAGGVFLVREGTASTDFISADLDLVPLSTVPAPEFIVVDGSTTPTGEVALTAHEGGEAFLLYEIAPDGIGEGMGAGEPFRLVGRGDQLSIMTFSNPDGVHVREYDLGMVVALDVPGLEMDGPFATDHRDHYAIAHPTSEPLPGQVFTNVAEYEPDGTPIRQGLLVAGDAVSEPTAMAISDDGSIWVATANTATGSEMLPDILGYLHRAYAQ